ncbi:alpha-L-fucosidase [Paenibacillus ferrarius]|uniref:alpha-L-fucosidase n=1 Tax=Paenibacillus ferrarius TaxID=1469647 RepID=UPI003D29B071
MGVSIEEAIQIVPSPRQMAWQEMEFYAFIHFGMNTFTGRQWGTGEEDPQLFDPTDLDVEQWVTVCREAGMTGVILTCKHHDGFCLWPSAYTAHSVRSAPWRGGQGDLVREVAEACRAQGLKFGVYLSPWDRNAPTYGDSPAYNRYFQLQLTELLTQYGEIFCVWLDGACGEGRNGKKQVYDWDGTYRLVREMQPGAVIAVCGPDVRWCGNEAGHTRRSEWSVVPAAMRDTEKVQADSQQADDPAWARRLTAEDEDLGSRAVLAQAERAIWYPSEVDVSIRPQWFYDPADDDQVKSAEALVELFERSVGGNSALLLNVPPDRRGKIHERDAAVLRELGVRLRRTYGRDLAAGAAVWASHAERDAVAAHVTDGRSDTYWSPPAGVEQAELVVDLGEPVVFDRVMLQEFIQGAGQRIESFELWGQGQAGDDWVLLDEGTVVGYKKICRLNLTTAQMLKLRITGSRIQPTLSRLGIFCSQ